MEATLRKRTEDEYKESASPRVVVVFVEVVAGDVPLEEFEEDDTLCNARVVLVALYFGVD